MKCCICGPVKNCGPYLDKVFKNIEKITSLFEDYVIIIYYDKSDDDTLIKLKNYQLQNNKMKFYINTCPVSKYRTHNIAKARNFCIAEIKENYSDFPFFIMMDFDDVNCKNVHPEIIEKYLHRQDWDCLSFNTSPDYYDIWGLSIYPYCFSYNHFKQSVEYYSIIQKYVENLLVKLPENELLKCFSAFNGFAIYKTNKFLNCKYDGRVRVDLLPSFFLKKHMLATNSPMIYKDYGNVNGYFEDCEHRAFHLQAIQLNNAEIKIACDKLFT
jgi:hypothetical protein